MSKNLMVKPKPVEPEIVENLAAEFCTPDEIAAVVGCTPAMLLQRYLSAMRAGRRLARSKLRRAQWDVASKGNIPMLIWLGKQYLGQSDKVLNGHADLGDLDYEYRPHRKQLSFEEMQELPIADLERLYRAAIGDSATDEEEP